MLENVRHRKSAVLALSHWKNAHLVKAIATLLVWIADRKAARALARRSFLHWKHHALGSAFEGWLVYLDECRERRIEMSRALAHWRDRLLSRAFYDFIDSFEDRKMKRELVRLSVVTIRKSKMSAAFRGWVHFRENWTMASSLWRRHTRKSVLSALEQYVRRQNRRRVLNMACTKFYRAHRLVRAFTGWFRGIMSSKLSRGFLEITLKTHALSALSMNAAKCKRTRGMIISATNFSHRLFLIRAFGGWMLEVSGAVSTA